MKETKIRIFAEPQRDSAELRRRGVRLLYDLHKLVAGSGLPEAVAVAATSAGGTRTTSVEFEDYDSALDAFFSGDPEPLP